MGSIVADRLRQCKFQRALPFDDSPLSCRTMAPSAAPRVRILGQERALQRLFVIETPPVDEEQEEAYSNDDESIRRLLESTVPLDIYLDPVLPDNNNNLPEVVLRRDHGIFAGAVSRHMPLPRSLALTILGCPGCGCCRSRR